MSEWAVFGVIVALISFVSALAVPMLKLNTTIVKLTVKLDHLEEVYETALQNSADTHKRIWARIDGHDTELKDHERRIQHIEDKEELMDRAR